MRREAIHSAAPTFLFLPKKHSHTFHKREVLTDGAYYMADIQLLIGQSSTEGERKKKERMRLKRQKLLPPLCFSDIRYIFSSRLEYKSPSCALSSITILKTALNGVYGPLSPIPETKGATDMSENRKYYYLKLKENFFTTEKMVILEAQSGQYFARLEPGRKSLAQTEHRFRSSRWKSAASVAVFMTVRFMRSLGKETQMKGLSKALLKASKEGIICD